MNYTFLMSSVGAAALTGKFGNSVPVQTTPKTCLDYVREPPKVRRLKALLSFELFLSYEFLVHLRGKHSSSWVSGTNFHEAG